MRVASGSPPLLMVLVLLASGLVFSGCITSDPALQSPEAPYVLHVTTRDTTGDVSPFVPVTLVDDTDTGAVAVLVASTNAQGHVAITAPETADRLVYVDTGRIVSLDLPAERFDIVVEGDALSTSDVTGDMPVDLDASLGLRVGSIIELGSWAYLYSANAGRCEPTSEAPSFLGTGLEHDCGLSEPTLEVDNDGTIYASSVCCVGGAPPVWVSRDDGLSWDTLGTPMMQREAFGIEGDFAIDDKGTMYFFDIELGAVQVSAWTKDGTHIHTTHQPSVPLVDRPWVRAEGDGTVYLVYNQGIGSSTFLRSTDHGRTFLEMQRFPHNFGNLARGNEPGHLVFAAPGAGPAAVVYESTDGGLNWDGPASVDAPDSIPTYVVPLVDDAGNRYLVFDGTPKEGEPGHVAGKNDDDVRTRVYVAHAPPGGKWKEAVAVSPQQGTHTLPWGAIDAAGRLVLAWYGNLESSATQNTVDEDTPWHLMMSVTLDATATNATYQTIVADPEPVLYGPMDRRLLDFIQLDVGPDGAAHVAYAHIPEGSDVETTVYLQTLANLGLSDGELLNGPRRT